MNSEEKANLQQGSDEWRIARAGCVTASRICDVLRKPRKGSTESVQRKGYLTQLVCERLTGNAIEEEFESWDLKRGKELEPFARTEYELQRGAELNVETIGFVEHPTIKFAGCSPDALVGADGLAQFKCPRRHVHLEYLESGTVPAEYRGQMLFEMACTGRKWNDFVSYSQDFPDHLQLFVVRLHRDEVAIAEIESEVVKFLADVEQTINRLPRKPGENVMERQLSESAKRAQRNAETMKSFELSEEEARF